MSKTGGNAPDDNTRATSAKTDGAPARAESAVAAILMPRRPIRSSSEAHDTLGLAGIIGMFPAIILVKGGGFPELGQTVVLLAWGALIANLGAHFWPALGFVSFALGTAFCVLLPFNLFAHFAAVGRSFDTGSLIFLAVIVLIWLAYLATLRAARFLKSR